MPRTFVITGAGSGIGRATTERLRAAGHAVFGVDLHNADITADLSTAAGRAALVDAVAKRSPDGIDGVCAAAGLLTADPAQKVVAVNYFGAVATFEGLRPLLAKSTCPRAVAICSTATLLKGNDDVVDACLEADEALALRRADLHPATPYIDSKRALAYWVRRTAISPEWAGAGILLNAIAPGLVRTAMINALLDDPVSAKSLDQNNPRAVPGYGTSEEIAELIDFLLGFENRRLVGQVIFIDGGTDAIRRTRHY